MEGTENKKYRHSRMLLAGIHDCMDAVGRATQEAKAEDTEGTENKKTPSFPRAFSGNPEGKRNPNKLTTLCVHADTNLYESII
jgi:hypothetical protein